MFKKLFNKLMSNEEIKDGVVLNEDAKGISDPHDSSNGVTDMQEPTPTEIPIIENQVPGVKVPEGHQVPGTNMSTGVSEETSSEEPDPNDPALPKEPEVDPSKIREDQTPD